MATRKEEDFNPTKERIHEIIFETDTTAGKAFDIALMIMIVASVLTVMLESVESINKVYNPLFIGLEWIFTIFFTIEYGLRLYCVYSPIKYATSFFGIVDLLAILPTYLGLILPEVHFISVIRALRLFRIFRIFKLGNFLKEWGIITKALKDSRPKLTVFIVFVLLMVTLIGSFMYLIEGGEDSQFTSIPRSIYWAIVTLTTVGYGDIAPVTPFGQFLAAIVMILGYAVIAVPTGIVSAEMVNASSNNNDDIFNNTQACKFCMDENHQDGAIYCKTCGEELNHFQNE